MLGLALLRWLSLQCVAEAGLLLDWGQEDGSAPGKEQARRRRWLNGRTRRVGGVTGLVMMVVVLGGHRRAVL